MTFKDTSATLQYNLNGAIDARHAAIAFVLAFLVSVVPLCFATYPPLFDYPSHIARIYILEHWKASPALQGWYDIRSFLLPNVGMDLVTLGLAKIFPITVAGRIFLALILGLMLSGCMVLHRCLHGHFSLWALVSAPFLFNWILLFGFLNYLLGVGLLLWAAGSWVLGSRAAPWRRLLWGTLFAVALFFCHFAALGLYAIIVAGYELQRSATTVRTSTWLAFRDLLVGAAIFLIPLLLFVVSPTSDEALQVDYWHPLWKPIIAYRALQSGNPILDYVTFAGIALGLVVVALYGRLRVAKCMYVPLAMLLVAYLVAPAWLLSARFVDTRLPVAILFVAIGCLHLSLRSKTCGRALLVGLAVLLIVRSIVLSYDWHRYDRVIHAFVTAFAELPPHSLLFVASAGPRSDLRRGFDLRFWQPPLNHVAALATLQQPIFVLTTFAHPSQQPIAVTSRYAALYNFQEQDPIRVQSAEKLAVVTNQIRRLAGDTGISAPTFLLVLYPEFLHLPLPQGTTAIGYGPHFVILAIDDLSYHQR